MVQILAPVAACWAAVVAASDPLRVTEICHDSASGGADHSGDQNGQHAGGCPICCLASSHASLDTSRPVAFSAPFREPARFAWHEQAVGLLAFRVGSNAQARAPPLAM